MRAFMYVLGVCTLLGAAFAAQTDFNRNGLPDIFVWNSHGLDWFERDADGNYAKVYDNLLTFSNITDVIVGDLNKDGRMEIIVALGGPQGGVYWYNWQDNALSYRGGFTYPYASALALGYLDPDGYPDLLVASNEGNGVGRIDLYEYRFGAEYSEGIYWLGNIAYVPVKRQHLAIYEVNGVGYFAYIPDVANNYVNTFQSTVDNTITWSWVAGQGGSTTMRGLLIDDLDNDAVMDLLTCDSGYTLWYKYLGNTPSFYSYNQFSNGGTWSILKSGYFANATHKTFFLGGNPDGLARFDGPSFGWVSTDNNAHIDVAIIPFSGGLNRGDYFAVRTDGLIAVGNTGWYQWLTDIQEYAYNGVVVAGTAAPTDCGDSGINYSLADFNRDCLVDLKDLLVLAGQWLVCTDPGGCL